MKLYAEMTDQELDQVNLIEFTKLNVGDRVQHANAGKVGGNAQIISDQLGTIVGHQNQGLYAWGGLCVTVTVQWDDGSQYDMGYSFAKKITK